LLTVVPAAYAGLGALLTRAVGFSPLLLAIGWVMVEISLRPLGLQPGLLSIAQEGSPQLHWVGTILGSAFVAFLVAGANAALLTLLSNVKLTIPGAHPRGSSPRDTRPRAWSSLFLQPLEGRPAAPRAPPPRVVLVPA
jgi:apolipoprotein N-acyltransferase